jgi:hypothetical protein
LTTTRDVHQETVTLLSDAVTDITKRAVEPTLAPFGAELRETVAALDVRLRTLDELLSDDRADRRRLTRQVGELPQAITDGNDELRVHLDSAVATIGELREQADTNAATLNRLRTLLVWVTVVVTIGVLASVAAAALIATA